MAYYKIGDPNVHTYFETTNTFQTLNNTTRTPHLYIPYSHFHWIAHTYEHRSLRIILSPICKDQPMRIPIHTLPVHKAIHTQPISTNLYIPLNFMWTVPSSGRNTFQIPKTTIYILSITYILHNTQDHYIHLTYWTYALYTLNIRTLHLYSNTRRFSERVRCTYTYMLLWT